MATKLGVYLNRLRINKSKLASLVGIKAPRMNDLCNTENVKPYANEFYKIIHLANQEAGLDESHFAKAVDEIFPHRIKVDLLAEYSDLSPEARFFKKFTQHQKKVERQLDIAPGKISKYFGDKNKRALAVEIIAFAEGLGLDVLETFKEIYGEVELQEIDK